MNRIKEEAATKHFGGQAGNNISTTEDHGDVKP